MEEQDCPMGENLGLVKFRRVLPMTGFQPVFVKWQKRQLQISVIPNWQKEDFYSKEIEVVIQWGLLTQFAETEKAIAVYCNVSY